MKALLLYVVLVGIPVVGVCSLLRFGEALTAPIPVGGVWIAETTSRDLCDRSCGGLKIPSDQLALSISQSGTYLVLTLNDRKRTALAGRIDNSTIVAAGETRSTSVDPSTDNEATIGLRARVECQDGADRLIASLTIEGCEPAVEFSFTAIRQAGARRTSGDR